MTTTTHPTRTRITRRRLLLTGAGAAAGIILAACSQGTAAPTTQPASPAPSSPPPAGASVSVAPAGSAVPATPKKLSDTIVLGRNVSPRATDPHAAANISQFLEPRQAYDALAAFDDPGQKLIPQLAASWSRIDPLTVEFKLRDDVKFQNGDPFSAATVKANLDRVMDPKNASLIGSLGIVIAPVAGAEVVNATTVRIKSKKPDPYVVNRMTALLMAPEKMIAAGADFNRTPVGTGAMKIVEFKENDHITYAAFDGSWKGKGPIQNARIVGIPDMGSLLSTLKTGEVDVAYQIFGDQAASVASAFNVTGWSGGGCSIMEIVQKGALADPRVRQALNYAVDKAAVAKATGGFSTPAEGQLIQPGMEGYNDAVKMFPYDPDKAMSLLKDAGAQNLEINLQTATVLKPETEAVTGFLSKVGLKVNTQILDPVVYIQKLTQKTEADMIHTQAYFWQMRTFDSASGGFGTKTNQFYAGDEFGALYAAQQSELDDAKRASIVKQAAQWMHDNPPCIFLLWVKDVHAFTKKIDTLPLSYDRSVHLWATEKAA